MLLIFLFKNLNRVWKNRSGINEACVAVHAK